MKDKNYIETTNYTPEQLKQKYAYVESSLSDSKDIKLILDEYFPDKDMFFYNDLEIYCKEKNLNYEKIKK